jgi:ABC-type glycerol-3-phosphate transport system substrate-binding protein
VKVKLKLFDEILIVLVLVLAMATVFVKLGVETVQEISGPTLVFAHYWQDEAEKQVIRSLADDFEKQHQGMKVVLRDHPYSKMQDIFLAPRKEDADRKEKEFLASDVFVFDSRWLYEIVQNGYIRPLTDFLQNPAPPLEEGSEEGNIEDEAITGKESEIMTEIEPEDGKSIEETWAVPLTSKIDLLFYNVDVLRAVGFDRPPKNWSDFKKYARVLSTPGHYGMSVSLSVDSGYPEIYPWIWAAGATMLIDNRPNFNGDFIVKSVDFFNSLKQEGLVSQTKTKSRKIEEFTSGKAGMMIASVSDIDIVRKSKSKPQFDVSTIPVPDNYSGKTVFGVISTYIGIGSQSRLKDEAWAFILFLSEHSPQLSSAVHAIPGNGNTPVSTSDGAITKAYDIYESGEKIQEFIDAPNVTVLDTIVFNALSAMLEPKPGETPETPETTVQTIQERWGEVIGNRQ